jgi:anti-sigma factor RsiW
MRWPFRRSVTCAEVLVTLQAYLDGETDGTVARQLLGHLGHCPHCDHERRVYADIKQSLASRRLPIDPEIRAALTAFGERISRGGH